MIKTLENFFEIFKPQGPFTDNPDYETLFEVDRLNKINQGVIVGSILSCLLVPLFIILDYILKPEIFFTLLQIRISVIVISLIVLLFSLIPIGRKKPCLFGSILTIMISASISLMCVIDQGPVDPYYAGFNLPMLGLGLLVPLSVFEAVFTFTSAWLLYFIPNFLLLQSGQTPIFISNNFFILTTTFIAFVASQFHINYRRKQWTMHLQLDEAHFEIKMYSRTLEEKVKERTQKLLQSERLAVVGQLAGGIAHDFNNHLTAILGLGELLLSKPEKMDNDVWEDINTIHKAGKRASHLVKQLLAFSRQQILDPKFLSLNEVIQDVNKLLHRLIGEDIELIMHLDKNLHNVRVDPIQIEQIVLNLAVNARDAMPHQGGKLIIETENVVLDSNYCRSRNLDIHSGHYAMLAVSDNGHGMSDEISQKMFEPFFTTKDPGAGTGLGLSSVYGIVKQTHGEIRVYSEEEIGTTIKIYFPCYKDSQKIETKPAKQLDMLPLKNKTILLVEDEDIVRDSTAKILREYGYRVVPARDGNEAIERADELNGNIDLLITDVIMPKMNGFELARLLLDRWESLNVLYVSGYTKNFVVTKGIIHAHSLFLQKPFSIDALNQHVRDAIEMSVPAGLIDARFS